MENSTRGVYLELMARVWLMSKGYDTFRSQNDHAPIDIVAVDLETGETIFCAAKAVYYPYVENVRKSGYPQSSAQKRLGVEIIGVTHEGSCFWATRGDV